MPFPFVSFLSELDANPVVKKALLQLSADIEGFLSKEHNADGTHGRVTAVSVTAEENTEIETDEGVASLFPFGTAIYRWSMNGSSRNYLTRGDSGQIVQVYNASATPHAEGVIDVADRGQPTAGEVIAIINSSTVEFDLLHNSGADFAWQRFSCPGSLDYTVSVNEMVLLVYDGENSRWRVVSGAGDPYANWRSGDILLTTAASCPSGFTRLSGADNRVLRGAATAGSTGGSDTHGHDVDSGATADDGDHDHGGSTGAEAAHTHTFETDSDGGSLTEFANGTEAAIYAYASDGDQNHTHTGTTDAGSSHSHSIGSSGTHTHGPGTLATSTESNLPAYYTIVICQKD